MSYVYSAGLQAAIYQRLAGDAALGNLIGTAIYDAPLEPGQEQAAPDHITLGEEQVRANNTKTSQGAVHDFSVTVHSGRDGFDTVKQIAGAVCAALVDAPLTLEPRPPGRDAVSAREGRAGSRAGKAQDFPAVPGGGGPGRLIQFIARTRTWRPREARTCWSSSI